MDANNDVKNIAVLAGIAGIGAAGIYLASKLIGSSETPETPVADIPECLTPTENKVLKEKRIQVVNTIAECKSAVKELRNHCKEYNILGLDCEWVTDGQYPVSLLQLSSSKGLCVLFRLCILKCVPNELQTLLEDRNIIKVGHTPQGDAQRLRDFDINVVSTLDLSYLALHCGYVPESLDKMSNRHLNIDIDKSLTITLSNWEEHKLTDRQIEYAANDALVSIKLFKFYSDKILESDSFFKRSQHLKEVCNKYLNVDFRKRKGTNYNSTLGYEWNPVFYP